jgi:hypothetical protein
MKGHDRFIFVYDDDSRDDIIRSFRDQAADADLSLTWFDAVVLTRKAREQATPTAEPNESTQARY